MITSRNRRLNITTSRNGRVVHLPDRRRYAFGSSSDHTWIVFGSSTVCRRIVLRSGPPRSRVVVHLLDLLRIRTSFWSSCLISSSNWFTVATVTVATVTVATVTVATVTDIQFRLLLVFFLRRAVCLRPSPSCSSSSFAELLFFVLRRAA